MSLIKERFAAKLPELRSGLKRLIDEHAESKISDVNVRQLLGGMRGVKSLLCDTSLVDPEKGLIIRGIPVLDLVDRLPEEIFHLLLIGELPDATELKDLQDHYKRHEKLPDYVWDVIKSLPRDTHPMTSLSLGIMSLEKDSLFRKMYDEGMTKDTYWEPMLEDSIRLLAKLPELAAGIYRIYTGKGDPIHPRDDLDWAANYAYMLGVDDPDGKFAKLMRLYLVLHSDHESGNVSALTTHVVGSSLSDAYYAVAAGLNGLAGPLHGLANQECLKFVCSIYDRYNGVPDEKQIEEFCWKR